MPVQAQEKLGGILPFARRDDKSQEQSDGGHGAHVYKEQGVDKAFPIIFLHGFSSCERKAFKSTQPVRKRVQ